MMKYNLFAEEESVFLEPPPVTEPVMKPAPAFDKVSCVVDNFLPAACADAMRKAIEAHFGNQIDHGPDTHQIWNYWHVHDHYTYFRTAPEKIISHELVKRFMDALGQWAIRTMGMQCIGWPYLSMYINGCQQTLHNDVANGRFGYVYSLTKNNRRTQGGRTIIMHEGDIFRTTLTKPTSTKSFYDAVEPAFNRMIVFDDRIPHAVDRIEGSMDPLEGRFVLHGHIKEGGPVIHGPVPSQVVKEITEPAVQELLRDVSASYAQYHGPMAVRFIIQESGAIGKCRLILDRVIGIDSDDRAWRQLVNKYIAAIRKLRFPPHSAATEVTLPVLIGGALPNKRFTEF